MSLWPGRDALRDSLESPGRPAGTLTYHQLQGFLFTVACAPDLIRPSEWLPVVFGEAEPGFSGPEEAEAMVGEIMGLYNEVSANVRGGDPSLPADCQFRDDILDNFEEPAPIRQWCRGFVAGHGWLEESWEVDDGVRNGAPHAPRVSGRHQAVRRSWPDARRGARRVRRGAGRAATRGQGGTQRPLPLRKREEVQEVIADGHGDKAWALVLLAALEGNAPLTSFLEGATTIAPSRARLSTTTTLT